MNPTLKEIGCLFYDDEQVSRWILLHGWTVGDLWNMMVEYSSQRFKQETKLGFFAWLLPSVTADDAMTFNALDAT